MVETNNSFKDKVVLITGASAGIGKALALAFAKEGASLALLARRLNRLQDLVVECQQQNNNARALAIVTDVTHENELNHAVAEVNKTLGTIDVVIANAGFSIVGLVGSLSLEDFKRQFETNVFGVLRTIYATLEDLKKSKGRLVIIGSVVSYISTPQYGAYSMSKHALTALAETLYFELAPYGISVTFICPGFIKTEIREINNLGVYQKNARSPLPDWIRLSPHKAAKIILKATHNRERERFITFHAKVIFFFDRFFPGLLPRLFRIFSIRKRAN